MSDTGTIATPRRALFGVLLAAAVFAAGYVVGRGAGRREATEGGRRRGASGTSPCAPTPRRQLLVYYFHPAERNPTCRTIEGYAREAIESGFADYLAAEDIVWQTADMDAGWNQGFVDRYGLRTSSLVLVEVDDGREVGHTVCRRIADLVTDKEAFLAYVRTEVAAHLPELEAGEEARE